MIFVAHLHLKWSPRCNWRRCCWLGRFHVCQLAGLGVSGFVYRESHDSCFGFFRHGLDTSFKNPSVLFARFEMISEELTATYTIIRNKYNGWVSGFTEATVARAKGEY